MTAGVAGCHRAPPRPDILLVTIDTLRADHCSAYGYPVATTPSLDRVARRGLLFRRTYAESSTTAPSHSVLMTGRHFRSLGTTKNGATLPDDAVTLAEALKDAGYATAAFVSSFPVMARFGFSQGFEVYDDQFTPAEASVGRQKEAGGTAHDRRGGATLAHFRAWLEGRHDDRPLFVWLHFVDPHAPYLAPEKFVTTWPAHTSAPQKRYDAEVHYADKQLGEALALFGANTRGRENLVVVTSDHGEGLGEHGWMSHGINLHEEAVRVPLVASWPGHLDAGKVVEDPVALVDIAPGILDLVGVDAKTFSAGRRLFGPTDASRSIFLERRDYRSSKERGQAVRGEMTAVVANGAKLILAPDEDRRELYDLSKDPRELADLLAGATKRKGRRGADAEAVAAEAQNKPAAAQGAAPNAAPNAAAPAAAAEPAPPDAATRALAGRLEDTLDRWQEAFPKAATSDAPVDKETLKALRSLGYVD